MREIFNMDGPVFRFLSGVADLLILNIVFLICCIPIVTIGASLTAMAYVVQKMKDDEGYIVKTFFKSFKQNFKQSTLIWLIMLALGLVMALDLRILHGLGGGMYSVVRGVVYVGILLWLMIFAYVFPLQARFYNTIRGTFRNAVLLAIGNLPKTLCMVVVMVGPAVATFLTVDTFVYGLLIWILVGFALVAYINGSLLHGIFEKLIDAQTAESGEAEEVQDEN